MSCRNSEEHSYDRLWTLFPYTGKYRALLKAYKFNKTLSLADFFAERILALIAENPVLADAVIVPVPPRPGKIKETGWDQVEYLVKRLAKSGKAPLVSPCLKRRVSKVQKRLSRAERIENLKGRVFVNKAVPKTVLIIDDVITTGSTMEACAAVLKSGGAERVYGLCLFYD
jgi:ComF family protein